MSLLDKENLLHQYIVEYSGSVLNLETKLVYVHRMRQLLNDIEYLLNLEQLQESKHEN